MHVVVLLLPVLLVAISLAALVAQARRPDPAPSQAAAAARRHATLVNVLALGCLAAGLAGGLAIVTGLAISRSQGILLGLVPAAAGLTFAAVQAAGELTWPRPTGNLRRAPLTRRTAVDVAPRSLRRVMACWAALTVVVLVGCGLASDDGRSIARTFPGGSQGAGPFPGWLFGIPLLVATAIVVLAAEGVLRLIAHRPAVMDADPAWDLTLRRVSAHRLLRGSQLVLGWTASGVLLVAGSAVRSVGTGASVDGVAVGSAAYAAAGIAALLLGAGVGLASLVLMFVPATPVAVPSPTGSASA